MNDAVTRADIHDIIDRIQLHDRSRNNVFARVWREGDRDAFEAALIPHLSQLCRLACRVTGNEQEAKKMVQEWLMEIYPERGTWSQKANLRRWLARSLFSHYVSSACHTACDKRPADAYVQRQRARARVLMMQYD